MYIGGVDKAELVMKEDFSGTDKEDDDFWILHSGSRRGTYCGRQSYSLSFDGTCVHLLKDNLVNIVIRMVVFICNLCCFLGPDRARLAVSAGVQVTELSYIQFDLAMGCFPGPCFSK